MSGAILAQDSTSCLQGVASWVGWHHSAAILFRAWCTVHVPRHGVLALLCCVIVAFLSGLFFYSIGVEFFILFAVFIALMNLIPFVGVFLSSVFAILYIFLTTDSLIYPILTFVCLWGIQLLENNLITPMVVGSKVKVNALAVIISILIGGWLWGISGMILFIPLVGIVKITLEKSASLQAFGFLLSDDVQVNEDSENFWKILRKKFSGDKK